MTATKDFYEVLGVGRNATPDEIQRAYRKLARTYHPDINKDPTAERRFQEVSEAYDVLSDPDSRRRYDAFGPDFRQVSEDADPETWARSGGATRSARRRSEQQYRTGDRNVWVSSGFQDADFDIDDLFSGFFGERRARRRGPMQGADQEAELPLTVEETYRGTKRSITLPGPDGTRTLDVTVPPGVTDGQRIRLAGQGGQGSEGAQPGDLYLIVRLLPHPRYRVNGRDITVDLPLAPWEGALGTTVAVETPDGEAKLRVRAGTSTGARLRLRGKGLPKPRGTPGDMYAEVRIMVPKTLTRQERELFEELAATSNFDPRKGT